MFTEHLLRTYPWARLDSALKKHVALNSAYYEVPRAGAIRAGASATWEERGVECSEGTLSARATHRLGATADIYSGGQEGQLVWQPLLFPLSVGWRALEAQPLLPDQAWVVVRRQFLPSSLLATAALPRG